MIITNEGSMPEKMSKFHTFYQDLSAEVYQRLKNIKLVVLDVDGSITEGSIILDNSTSESKHFNCKDGMGISLLIQSGIEVAIITGRDSPLTARRAKELKINHVIQGQSNKEISLMKLMKQVGVTDSQLAVLGDDVNDLPLYKHAAVSACPKDGYHYMQLLATINLTCYGGKGAAREFADLILMAQNKVDPISGEPFFITQREMKFGHQ